MSHFDKIRKMVEEHKPRPIGKYRYYAVLIPLIRNSQGEPEILFEVRSETLRKQPGEIGLPGGKVESGETPAVCAVRETTEELGIPASAIKLYGELNFIPTYSNFTMYCFAGELEKEALESAKLNRSEVKEIFSVPLSFFLSNKPIIYVNEIIPVVDENFPLWQIRAHDGYSWRHGKSEVPIYTWKAGEKDERVIWGLTARLIYDFVGLVDGVMS
jgi:8-oxo-dGTP pyrophosphatase MutT (NUDIX family)